MPNITLRLIFASSLLFAVSAHAAPAISLPQTGQTLCYDAAGETLPCSGSRQDGDIRSGLVWPADRFATSRGTVVDNLTDLVWLRNADCFRDVGWQQALDHAKSLASGACGLDDGSVAGQWRLPNRKELLSLANFQQPDGGAWLIGRGFVDAVNYWYWTSDSFVGDPAVKWVFHPAGALWPDDQSEINPRSFHALFVRDRAEATITLAPETGSFGSVDVGRTSVPLSITISNTGTSGLAVAAITLTGSDSTLFALDAVTGAGACGSLAPAVSPGGNCRIAVTFAPATAGVKTASLRVASNAANAPIMEVALSGTGIETFAVEASVSGGNGTITSTHPVSVSRGGTASFTVAPATGYVVNSTVGGSCPSGSFNGATYTTGAITSNCSVSFTFDAGSYSIGTAVTPSGSGTITCSPGTTVDLGTAVSCEVTHVPGYRLIGVTVDGVAQAPGSASFTHLFGAVTANHSIAATFAAEEVFTVTFTAESNGTLTGTAVQPVIKGGAAAAVTAVPSTGYRFVNWTGPGGFVSTANPLTLSNVIATQTITANFVADSFLVTPVAAVHGALIPSNPQSASAGGVISFILEPASGYHIASAAGCGGALSGSTYATAPITADCTVEATFEADGLPEIVRAYQYVMRGGDLTDREKRQYDVAPLGNDGMPSPDGVVGVADVIIMLRRQAGLIAW